MPQLLIIVASVLVLAGIAGIAAGAPTWFMGLGLGAALIQSGTASFVGGLVLLALALVLQALRDLQQRLDALGAPVQWRTPEPPAEMPRRIAHTERVAPLHAEPPPAPRREPPAHPERVLHPEPPRAREPRREVYAEDGMRRREIPPEDHEPRPRRNGARPHMESEPSRGYRGPPAEAPRGPAGEFAPPRREPAPDAPEPEEQEQGEAKIVRSGIIGEMAYTLYADGSIEADLPMGTVRFNSLAELQEHVSRDGAEADNEFGDAPR